jgi:signal peptidase I
VPRQPVGEYIADDGGPKVLTKLYVETLPDSGLKHDIIKLSDDSEQNNTIEFVVPPGDVFAMGDNRDNSQDSRFQSAVGYVPLENLVGRAEFIFFSIDATYPWWEVWEWPFEIRWSRLFTSIT